MSNPYFFFLLVKNYLLLANGPGDDDEEDADAAPNLSRCLGFSRWAVAAGGRAGKIVGMDGFERTNHTSIRFEDNT